MHGDLLVRPWFIWFFYGVTAVLLLGAAAVIVDSVRRPAEDFGRLGRAPWLILQTLFLASSAFALVAGLLKFSSGLPRWFASVLGLVVIAAAVQQVAYLLRVVFPKTPRFSGTEDVPGEEASDVGTHPTG